MPRGGKDSAVERKLRAVEQELNGLRKGMKSLSKEMGRVRRPEEEPPVELPPPQAAAPLEPRRSAPAAEKMPSSPALPIDEPRPARTATATSSDRIREGRFADYYLANSSKSPKPLRHELRIQRNRAIFMLIVTLLALSWFVHRWGGTLAGLLTGPVSPHLTVEAP